MAMLFDTIPSFKMPDDETLEHIHYVIITTEFEITKPPKYPVPLHVADLTEYYSWSEHNGIFMEHNVLVIGAPIGKIMFVFENEEDALAFKLRWAD